MSSTPDVLGPYRRADILKRNRLFEEEFQARISFEMAIRRPQHELHPRAFAFADVEFTYKMQHVAIGCFEFAA
jgi:hypothetical protein